jgi:hypothetical protein
MTFGRAAAYLFGLALFCATIIDAIFGVNSFSSPGNAGAAIGSATGAFLVGFVFAGAARLFTRSHGKNWTASFVVGVIAVLLVSVLAYFGTISEMQREQAAAALGLGGSGLRRLV